MELMGKKDLKERMLRTYVKYLNSASLQIAQLCQECYKGKNWLLLLLKSRSKYTGLCTAKRFDGNNLEFMKRCDQVAMNLHREFFFADSPC